LRSVLALDIGLGGDGRAARGPVREEYVSWYVAVYEAAVEVVTGQ
jgi:hypothetical protein